MLLLLLFFLRVRLLRVLNREYIQQCRRRHVFVDLVEAGEFDGTELLQQEASSAWHVTSEVESGHGVDAEHEEIEHLHSATHHDTAHLQTTNSHHFRSIQINSTLDETFVLTKNH